MRSWLDAFGDEQLARHPGLALAAANGHFLRGELDPVQRLALAGRRVLRDAPSGRPVADGESAVAILDALSERGSVAAMGEHAARAAELEPEDSAWQPACCLLEGVAAHLTGDSTAGERKLEEGARRGTVSAPHVQTLCLAQLAVLAGERGDWAAGVPFVRRARAQVQHYGLDAFPGSALVLAVSAAVEAHRGRIDEARADGAAAQGMLATLTDFMPWYETETRIVLAGAELRMGRVAEARELLAEAARRARRVPDAPALQAMVEAGNAQVGRAAAARSSAARSLTPAELRVLAFLPTHLSFPEIAGRAQLSTNTIKTQVARRLPQARGRLALGGGRARDGLRPARPVIRMTVVAAHTREQLSGISHGDMRLLEETLGGSAAGPDRTGLDRRTCALARIAALIALDAPPASYAWQVADALDDGASVRDIVGTLCALAPDVGGPRTVAAASELLLALGLQRPGQSRAS